jgi:biopolymer transport protein ExbD
MKRFTSSFLLILIIFASSCTSVKDSGVANEPSAKKQEQSAMMPDKEYYLVWDQKGDLYVRYYDTPTGKIYLADGRRFQMKYGRKMYLKGSRAGEMESEVTAYK